MRLLIALLRLLLQPPRATEPRADKDGTDDVLAFARAAFDAEQARYDAAETKAARYITVLGVLLAGAAIKGDDLLWTLRHSTAPRQLLISFAVSYGVMFVLAFLALLRAIRVMAVERVPAIPIDRQIPELFKDHPRSRAIDAMATAFFNETASLRETNGRRSDALQQIYWYQLVTLWVAALSLILYALIVYRTPDRTETKGPTPMTQSKDNTSSGSQQQSTSTTSHTSTSTATPPKFDTVKKSDDGKHERR